MQRCVDYQFLSRTYRLMYNGAAMFALKEQYPEMNMLVDTVLAQTQEGVEALYAIWLILAENGEAVKRWLGYEPCVLPKKEELAALTTVDDLNRMRDAVLAAITAGLGREFETQAKVIDLGLEELERENNSKKKA